MDEQVRALIVSFVSMFVCASILVDDRRDALKIYSRLTFHLCQNDPTNLCSSRRTINRLNKSIERLVEQDSSGRTATYLHWLVFSQHASMSLDIYHVRLLRLLFDRRRVLQLFGLLSLVDQHRIVICWFRESRSVLVNDASTNVRNRRQSPCRTVEFNADRIVHRIDVELLAQDL